MKYDAIIIGGGAAGLFCAIQAGKRGRKTLVIEHNTEVGRKIIISGGGRCNFTNTDTRPENFISKNPHFCKSALARYTPQDFIALIKKHRIEYYEKKLGQLFCRGSSRAVVTMLLEECERAGVEVQTQCAVRSVAKNEDFELVTTQGPILCKSLVIASGGLSFPKVGATDFGYRIARQFGIKITETRPSLVAMVMKGGRKYSVLAGISVDAEVSMDGQSFRENILFTHRGLSGPAILQISNYWQKPAAVTIDLLPTTDAAEIFEKNRESRQNVGNFLARQLPARFVESFVAPDLLPRPLNSLSSSSLRDIGNKLNNWPVEFEDTEGYHRAEVTLGGVSTDELSSQTMESKRIAGLYFIGEVVDVTGWLGGYNFQWAWSSAFAAGQAV